VACIRYYVRIIVWYSLWNIRILSGSIASVLCFVKITPKETRSRVLRTEHVGECEGVIFDSCSVIVTTDLDRAKPEF